MHTISDLKVTLLGVVPKLKDESGELSPQEILALSALLTFKGKSIQRLKKDIEEKGENLKERVKKILLNSALKGHASITTTPVISYAFEGSKFLDSALTGIVFSSSLITSGRRTDVTFDDIVVPPSIEKNADALKLYVTESQNNITFFNSLLEQGLGKSEVRKIYQYGVYGTAVMTLPLESLITLKREWEFEKEWMPDEVGLFLQKMEEFVGQNGLDWLYSARVAAPKESYPYPNIFKDPRKLNFARYYRKKRGNEKITDVVDIHHDDTAYLRDAFLAIEEEKKKTLSGKDSILSHRGEILKKYRDIFRDMGIGFSFKTLTSCSWGVWTEKKRHRSVPLIPESIYYAVDKAYEVFEKHKEQIVGKNTTAELIRTLDFYFAIPPCIRPDAAIVSPWIERAYASLYAYVSLVKMGIPAKDALYVVPRGLKLDTLQEFNLYNLILGYYPVRLCSTADEEIMRLALQEDQMLRKYFGENDLSFLIPHMGPKCWLTHFCPEKKFCPKIKARVADYDEEFHAAIHGQLEKDFEKKLEEITI